LQVDWGGLTGTRVNPIFDAWQALDGRKRRVTESALQSIHTMATGDGIAAIIEDAQSLGQDIRPELDRFDSGDDKAMWTYLHHRSIWDKALIFTHADQHGTYRRFKDTDGVHEGPLYVSSVLLRQRG
jgi:hypothetical protein